jgi:hypothetical protein
MTGKLLLAALLIGSVVGCASEPAKTEQVSKPVVAQPKPGGPAATASGGELTVNPNGSDVAAGSKLGGK